ncbi:hypothetical protein PILCRDRAFT_14379 [Piloderma croceum F 1598]|uniref:Uncharacterized protein n=1 Tax=Piloderma croceum (strain F 1598) TaxID=765440 RepID=A0A0C3AKN1_PILCF|nr:hypothetical protein PILCRDRAFT_14379 [Piloderma croceum F 1598]
MPSIFIHACSRALLTFASTNFSLGSAKLKRTEAAIEQYRDQIDPRKAKNSCFVSMVAVPYTYIIARILRKKHPKGTDIALVPNPKDIVRYVLLFFHTMGPGRTPTDIPEWTKPSDFELYESPIHGHHHVGLRSPGTACGLGLGHRVLDDLLGVQVPAHQSAYNMEGGFKSFFWPTHLHPLLQDLHQEKIQLMISGTADTRGYRLEKHFRHSALQSDLFTPMSHAMMPPLAEEYKGGIDSNHAMLNEYGGQKLEVRVIEGGVKFAAVDQCSLEDDPTLYQRDRGELDWSIGPI